MTDEAGATLLEPLVALALIALLLLPAYQILGQGLALSTRSSQRELEELLALNALSFAEGLNPGQQPEGEALVGNVKLTWHSEPASVVAANSGFPIGRGKHQVALYDVTIVASNAGVSSTTQTTRIGWKRVSR